MVMLGVVFLLIGGYGDLFGGLENDGWVLLWVYVVSLLIVGVSVLYVISVIGIFVNNLFYMRFVLLWCLRFFK